MDILPPDRLQTSEWHYLIPQIIELYDRFPRLKYSEIADELQIKVMKLSVIISYLINSNQLEPRKGRGFLIPTEEQLSRLQQIIYMRRDERKSWQDIATSLCVTRQAVYQFVQRHLEELIDEEIEPAWVADLSKLYNNGMISPINLAKEMGVSITNINEKLRYLDSMGKIKRRRAPRKGVMEKVKKLHGLRLQGMKWRQIADEYGLKPSSYTSLSRLYENYKSLL
jgi:predicted transcriptional regulator